jgi:hypothetical protein
MQGGTRIETARKRYTDSFAYRDPLENSGHAISIIVDRMAFRASVTIVAVMIVVIIIVVPPWLARLLVAGEVGLRSAIRVQHAWQE